MSSFILVKTGLKSIKINLPTSTLQLSMYPWRRSQGGYGGSDPPWTSKIYGFKGVLCPTVAEIPRPPEIKKVYHPLGQISSYAPKCRLGICKATLYFARYQGCDGATFILPDSNSVMVQPLFSPIQRV